MKIKTTRHELRAGDALRVVRLGAIDGPHLGIATPNGVERITPNQARRIADWLADRADDVENFWRSGKGKR